MSRPKIIVTEDESIVAMDIKQRLENLGFEVIATEATGAGSISRIESNRPDLALMDIQIKGDMDGIETAALIQERFNIPVVFLTANSDMATIERAKTAGPLAYLIKPFEDRELKASIEIALYRHNLECELTEQKEWWRTTLSSIGDAVITTDTKAVINFLNPVAEKLTQWDRDQAIGKPLNEVFKLFSEETGQPLDNPIQKVLKTGQVVLLSNHSALKRPDGSLLSIEDSAAPILSQNNEIIGVVLVFHDVTKQRTREHESQEYQGQLEEKIDSRTAALLEANKLLRQEILEREKADAERVKLQDELDRAERMKALGLLAGGVAHDLNNMLGPMVGYPELILRKLPNDSPVRKQIERIASSAKDAASVIQDLLTLARRGRYDMEAINPNQVITDYLESPGFEKKIQENPGIEVVLNLKSNIPFIKGSSPHLSKVLMNLIVNGIDAIENTGTLTIETRSEHLEKLISGYNSINPGEYTILSVRDTGCGIQPKDMEKIFEPYYSSKEMKSHSGSGLGLAIVYGIVKDHGGYYDILSEVGKGTEFILYIPATLDAPTNADVTEAVTGGHETIMVVDDNEGQRELLKDALLSIGYEVVLAKNGHDAINIIKDRSVDLIMLDMIMEDGFDGLDTYREIIKHRPHQKAIIVSGYSSGNRVEEAQKLGAGAYLRKPFVISAMAEMVRDELDKTLIFSTK